MKLTQLKCKFNNIIELKTKLEILIVKGFLVI